MKLAKLQTYLHRIGLPEDYLEKQGFYCVTEGEISNHLEVSTKVKLETLVTLHRAHATQIPFDNKDSFDGKILSLKKRDIFYKLITQAKGGCCLETNELLGRILNFLKIKTDRLQARVDVTHQTEFTHKLLLVTVGEELWLADVGFGGKYPSLRDPIPLKVNRIFEQGHCEFKILEQAGLYILLAKEKLEADFRNLYSFDLTPYAEENFRDSDGKPKLPESFSQKHIVSQWLDETRVWSIETRRDKLGFVP